MRAYLGLVATRREIAPFALEAAVHAAAEAVPVAADELTSARWISANRGVALLSWSNEPVHELLPEPLSFESGRVLGHCGYLADPMVDGRALLAADDLGSAAEALGGCFSAFRADDEGLEGATSLARVCPIYYTETDDLHIVGSRALLVHLVARAVRTRSVRPAVDFDVPALQALIRHGFFTSDETPFRGVSALPAASVLTVRRGERPRIDERPVPRAEPAPRAPHAVRERVSRLVDALLASAMPLVRHEQPVTLALSGGRDSRVMAAVLASAGVPLRSRTHGFADDPDVILGSRIAATLEIENQVRLTTSADPESITVEHPLRRAHHVIRMCEGMTSAYESVSRPGPYGPVPKTSGSGGETLRGGFLVNGKDSSAAGLGRRVRRIFHSADKYLTAEANEHAEANHRPWAERARADGFDALDKLYLFYRTGRWIVGSHTATLIGGPYYHPFFDNRVVREALMLPARWRQSEEPVFAVLQALAPELTRIPPEGERWRFEQTRPRSLREWAAWRHRAAVVPANTRTSGFNWRTAQGAELRALICDQINDSPRELFDIVDEAAVKELLAAPVDVAPKNLWHIYTLSVLLSGRWRDPEPDLPDVRIPLPVKR